MAAAAVAVLLIACGGGRSSPVISRTQGGAGRTLVPGQAAHRPSARACGATPSPGSLPQTHAYPSGTSAQFKASMASLWSGIVSDSPAKALVAFFPRDAYVRLKAITSASSDWSDRLVHDYRLDVAAAHALLGAGAPARACPP